MAPWRTGPSPPIAESDGMRSIMQSSPSTAVQAESETQRESILKKRAGLFLFFAFLMFIVCLGQTHLMVFIEGSRLIRRAIVLLSCIALVYGWISSIKQPESNALWRRVIAFISAMALTVSVPAFWLYTSVVPRSLHWWAWISYRFVFAPNFGALAFKGAAIFGTFLGVGRARLAFLVALTAMCLIW